MHNAVGIDIERHFNLRHASWRWWNTDQVELPKQFVVIGHIPFTLKHADRDGCLTISCRREHLAFFGWNSRVALNELGEYATQRLNAQ